MSKEELVDIEDMDNEEYIQYEDYKERQRRLAKEFNAQEAKREVKSAKELLIELGYVIHKGL